MFSFLMDDITDLVCLFEEDYYKQWFQ